MALKPGLPSSAVCAKPVIWMLMIFAFAAGGTGLIRVALAANPPSCLSASGETAVQVCRYELDQAPHDHDIRFALSDALIGLDRFQEAVNVLREGLEHFPGSNRIKKKLTLAESLAQERSWIEQRRARTAQGKGRTKLDATAKRNVIRCTKLKGNTAIEACNEALQTQPGDPSLHKARADALLSLDQIGESILGYRKALKLEPGDSEMRQTLQAAQAKREALVSQCQQQNGSGALASCQSALQKGERDESSIQVRIGELFLGMQQTKKALSAYEAALAVDPNNKEITDKIALLTEPKTVEKQSKTSVDAKPRRPVQKTEQKLARMTDKPERKAKVEITPPPAAKVAAANRSKRYSNVPTIMGITH